VLTEKEGAYLLTASVMVSLINCYVLSSDSSFSFSSQLNSEITSAFFWQW